MYLLTNDDKWRIGRLHEHLEHDCDLTNKGYCSVHERLENAYMWTMEDEMKLRTKGDMSSPFIA